MRISLKAEAKPDRSPDNQATLESKMLNAELHTLWVRANCWVIQRQTCSRLWERSVLGGRNLCLALQSIWTSTYPLGRVSPAVSNIAQRNLGKLQSMFHFLRALALNPRGTGAVLPSSKYLARGMVSCVELSDSGVVVELGAGTGVFTQMMLDDGIPGDRIIAVEYCSHLARLLREKFPEITVIEGNVLELANLLQSTAGPIDTIISGLPLRSLPDEISQAVLDQVPELLSRRGRFIQFTYDIVGKDFYPSRYQADHSKIVWRNVPPAKVEVFSFSGNKDLSRRSDHPSAETMQSIRSI
jgi:phosphatidylethanolamine/phosphatidyl-N-methylethanolamine N-methyltransferase